MSIVHILVLAHQVILHKGLLTSLLFCLLTLHILWGWELRVWNLLPL